MSMGTDTPEFGETSFTVALDNGYKAVARGLQWGNNDYIAVALVDSEGNEVNLSDWLDAHSRGTKHHVATLYGLTVSLHKAGQYAQRLSPPPTTD